MSNKLRYIIFIAMLNCGMYASAQFNNSGINSGFFDSSESGTINFSNFHLPPLAVLFENAKSNPQILDLAKAQEIAQAEVAKQKKHIFSYLQGHASYSYGKTDMWGNNSSTYNQMIYQFQGTEQNYWNIGVNLSVPLEDILDLSASVKRKRLLVEQAQIRKDIAYDQLKLQIASLYVKITNTLVSLKTASENAAIYQGAGALNQEDFHMGNMSIEDFAYTKLHEEGAVSRYQELQTSITTDIITLEILTHTPIITNATTDITLDANIYQSEKQIAKENRRTAKKIRKAAAEEEKELKAFEKAEKKNKEKEAEATK
ncbi:MAG: TolC family protein [Prevotella sp.]